MKKKNHAITRQKEHLQNLLESFSEKDLYVVISFAEFIFKSKSAEKLELVELLNKAKSEKKEMDDATLLQIRKAREGVRKGKHSSLDEIKREFGL
jgi:hypothetical protein